MSDVGTWRMGALALALCCASSLSRAQQTLPAAAGSVTETGAPGEAPPAAAEPPAEPDPTLATLLDSAVVRLAEAARADAARKLEQKQYPSALRALETAHELDPQHLETTERLAELQDALGHAERAEPLYRELIALAPERGAGYLALADLLARDRGRPERLEEAAAMYARAQERLGAEPSLILRRARLATARGLFADAEREYRAYLAEHPADDALSLELGDFYRDANRPEDALSFYRRVSAAEPAKVAAQRIFELEVDKEARRYGLARRDERASEQARAAAQRARLLASRGQLGAAEAVLREALATAPAQAVLRADLADVLAAAQQPEAAELEYLRALALDGSQPEVYVHLAELYLAARPPRAPEASWLLERALATRPEWSKPHLLLARAYREQGDLPRALLHVTRLLAQGATGPEQEQALVLQASLQTALGADAVAEPEPPAEAEAEADRSAAHLARARAFLARGQTDSALAELRRLDGSALTPQAFELQARVLYAAGRTAEAEALLERARAQGSAGPAVFELLGEVSAARHDANAARRYWQQCARAGSAACDYRLAKLDAGDGAHLLADLARAPALLRAHARMGSLIGAEGLPLSAAELVGERSALAARLWSVALLAACLALLALAAALGAWRALFGGLHLAELLARHPRAAPDVQRVLSAIRHEVLKHNTLMLAGTAEALAHDRGAADAAEHMASALFGLDGQGGAAARFEAYAAQLVQVGRAHGERLNLRRRDPALSQLYRGLAALRRLRGRLLAVAQLSAAARRRLAKRLWRANERINVTGQAELGKLLEHLRSLTLSEPQLRGLFERTRMEPALASQAVAPLELELACPMPCSVAIPAQAFEDILVNLFRNALEASLRHAQPRPVVVGLCVERELDEVTGLSRVALRVRDRAPEPLDLETLRGGYIEAGLGLTADLVARHEGTLEVTASEPGFSKAVVLRLPSEGP